LGSAIWRGFESGSFLPPFESLRNPISLSNNFEAREILMDKDIKGSVRHYVADLDLDCKLFPMRMNDQRSLDFIAAE
jgi:hypothetical protein